MSFKKNTAVTGFVVHLVSSTDGSDITTGTPVGYYTLDGGTQTAIADVTPVHEGNGQWSFDLTAGEMDGDVVGLIFTHASAITASFTIKTDTVIVSDLNDLSVANVTTGSTTALTDLSLDHLFDAAIVGADVVDNSFAAKLVSSSATADYDDYDNLVDSLPAISSVLSGLSNVGSAVNTTASSYTLTTGTQSANLYTDTAALDGVRHTHTDDAGSMDLYYEMLVGGGTPSSVHVTGKVTGGNDSIGVYGYDWVSAGWVQVGTMTGANSSANEVDSFDLFTTMVGSGADEGRVRVRFYAASGLTSATLYIDQIFVGYSSGVEGYDNGAVWFNSNASNTGTVVNVDGTARNPVSTSAALLTLLASTGLHKVEITPGSTLTMGGAYEGYSVNGNGSVLALGGQNIGGTVIGRFGSVTGVGTTTGSPSFFEDCVFGTVTLPPCITQQCGFGDTATQVGPGDFTHVDCYSTVTGAGSPTFTRSGGGVATIEYRRFSGGVTQSGLTGSDVVTISGELGTVTLNGASASVDIRGTYKAIVDNRTGSPVLNIDGARVTADVDQIDGSSSSATNLAASTQGITTGSAVTGTLSTTQMSTDLVEATDDHFNGGLVIWTTGNLKGQGRAITDYDGSGKILTFDAATEAAANTDEFVIV